MGEDEAQLREHTVQRSTAASKVAPSPLMGKLFDEAGEGLTPSHTAERRTGLSLLCLAQPHAEAAGGQGLAGLPAVEIERSVAGAVRKVLDDPSAIAVAMEEAGVGASQIRALLDAARACSELLQSEVDHAAMLAAVDRVELKEDGMRLWFRVVAIPLTDRPLLD